MIKVGVIGVGNMGRHHARIYSQMEGADLVAVADLREEAEEVKAARGREMLQALELPMALDTAEMICRSALMRAESRGAHYRVDYPEEDESWLRVIYLQKRGGEMRLHVKPLSSNA